MTFDFTVSNDDMMVLACAGYIVLCGSQGDDEHGQEFAHRLNGLGGVRRLYDILAALSERGAIEQTVAAMDDSGMSEEDVREISENFVKSLKHDEGE
jgi:hypothetical protein